MAKNIAFWQKENDFGKKQGQLTLEEKEDEDLLFLFLATTKRSSHYIHLVAEAFSSAIRL